MTRHARKPAIVALMVGMAAGGAVLWGTGEFRSGDEGPASVNELERKIAAGSADAGTWQAYGDALREAKRFDHAAAAYQRALELDPDRPVARFDEALALGEGHSADRFFDFFSQLTARDPKQAVDLLDRPELAGLHGDGRWEGAAVAARAQAAD